MRKVILVLVILCLVGIAQADVVVDGADWAPTNAWMNVQASEGNWGSAWGLPDVRTNEIGGYWTLQTNINGNVDNSGDPYWDPPGHLIMEGVSYTETWGLAGQNVTFNFDIASNNLGGAIDAAGNPYVTEAFIKTLNPDAGWATIQEIYASLPVGAGTLSLLIDSVANPVVQVGFRVMGSNDAPGSATADAAVVITPEPATMLLLGLGGLLLRRKK